MELHSAGIFLYHILCYFIFGAVVFHLARLKRLSLWLLLLLAMLAGLAMELANDSMGPQSVVSYVPPRIYTLPGTQIPLSIVIGWGSASVLTRLVNDRIGRALIKTKSAFVSQILHLALLIPVAFLAGFVFEFAGTIPGVWIYRQHQGALQFPIWVSGPSTYAIMIPLMSGLAELLSYGFRKLVALARPQRNVANPS